MGQMHAEKMNYAGEIGEFFRGGVKASTWLRVAAIGRVRHGRAGDAFGRGVLAGHAGRAADGLVSHARELLIAAVNEASGASTRQQQFLIPHFFEGFVTIFGD
jgi:hypothetical protein